MEPRNKSDPTIEDVLLAHSVANLWKLLQTMEEELITLQTQKQTTLHQLTSSNPSQKLALQKELESIADKEEHLLRQLHNLRASLEAIELQYDIECCPAGFDNAIHSSPLDTLRKTRKEREDKEHDR
jgi:hypothetical protein